MDIIHVVTKLSAIREFTDGWHLKGLNKILQTSVLDLHYFSSVSVDT